MAHLSWDLGGAAPTSTARSVDGIDVGAFGNDPTWTGTLGGEPASLVGAGHLVAGRYRLIERLARGGTGAVWSARDEKLQRDVAVKLLRAHPAEGDDGEVRARFTLEARAVAALSSPHVVTVFDEGVDDGVPFIVLERLDGEDLHHRLARQGSLSLTASERLLTHVARGLDAAHAAGIVHRDIKPSNIFLVRGAAGSRADGVAKVVDFGLAKRGGASGLRTRTGVVLGTPDFMSPEQLRGSRDVDRRSDLFSLGAVLYLCITGRRPFGNDAAEAMVHIGLGTFAPPSRLVAGLPEGTDAFFARALATDPAARFPSAGAMARAFRRIVRGTATASAPDLPRATTLARIPRSTPPSAARSSLSPPRRPSSPPAADDTVELRSEQAAGFVHLDAPVGSSPWARGDAPAASIAAEGGAPAWAGPSRHEIIAAASAATLLAATLVAVVVGLVSGG